MAVSAEKGPLIIFGQRPPLGSGGSENPDRAPSLFDLGIGIIDARWGYNTTRAGAIAWYNNEPMLVDQVPSAISATNIAAAQAATTGVALTLVSSSGAGITVLSAIQPVSSIGNWAAIPANALAIDGVAGLVNFGRAQNANSGWTTIACYDPTKAIARNVRVTSVGNDSGGTFTVSGFDLYGFPQTETITGANAGVASGKKSFKYIVSVTPGGTMSGSNVSVGTGDVYGIPMRTLSWEYQDIYWAGSLITSSTGFLVADQTSPATSTTGDVRGTYATQSASNGTNKLTIFMTPSVASMAAGTIGVTGVTPA